MSARYNRSLADWLQQRGLGTLSPQEIVHLVRQAASALQDVHNRRLVYRNVNPRNFLIRPDGAASGLPDLQLVDPDSSVPPSAGPSSISQLVTNDPLYVAPEQWKGTAFLASDQYALAMMVYQLLTAHSPFHGPLQQVMDQHLQTQPEPPSSLNPRIPPALDAVILRALAKRPQDRYSSVSVFVEAFEHAFPLPASVFTLSPSVAGVHLSNHRIVPALSSMLNELVLVGTILIIIIGGIGFGLFSIVQSNQTAVKNAVAIVDPLNHNTNGRWPETSNCQFADGAYHVIAPQTSLFAACLLHKLQFRNVAIQVDISLIAGSEAELIFRVNHPLHGNFSLYNFGITNQRGWFFFQSGKLDKPPSTMKTLAIAPGQQKNTLRVIASGSNFTFYINSIDLGEVQDSTLASGQIGFAAAAFTSAARADASFSNFAVFPL